MFDILNIPLPVLPGGAMGMVVGAGTMMAGVLLLALGRVIVYRVVSAVCLGGLGLPIAAWVIERTAYPAVWTTMVTVGVMAALGYAAARFTWATFVGAAAACGAMLAIVHLVATPETPSPAGFDAEGLAPAVWAQMTAQTLGAWLTWLLNQAAAVTLTAAGAAGATGMALGVTRPLATRIVATSVVGAAMGVAGICMTAASLNNQIDFCAGHRPWGMLCIGAVAAVGGIIYQTRGHLAGRETAEPDEQDDEEESDAKSNRKTKGATK